MTTRMIFTAGAIVGYYLGAKAGRQRYEQMNRLIGKARRSTPAQKAAEKAKSVASEQAHAAKDKVSHKLHHNGNGAESIEFTPS